MDINNMNIVNNTPAIIMPNFYEIGKDKNGETLTVPTFRGIAIPAIPNYRDSMFKEGQLIRKPTNSFGTLSLDGFNGTPETLTKFIGANFNAVLVPHYHKINGKEVESKGRVMINDKTSEQIGSSTYMNGYEPIQFEEAIRFFFYVLEEIKNRGYAVSPAYGKVYGGGGAKMFLQYKIEGNKIHGEPVDTFLSLITSHDKTMGVTIALSVVRLFCANQINRCLKAASNKISFHHTKATKDIILSNARTLEGLMSNKMEALEEYTETLSNIAISEEDIYNALLKSKEVLKATTQRKIDNIVEDAKQVLACYHAEDLNNFRGTALGAYYAFQDFADHTNPHRATSDETYFERGENPDAANFIDTLVSMK